MYIFVCVSVQNGTCTPTQQLRNVSVLPYKFRCARVCGVRSGRDFSTRDERLRGALALRGCLTTSYYNTITKGCAWPNGSAIV